MSDPKAELEAYVAVFGWDKHALLKKRLVQNCSPPPLTEEELAAREDRGKRHRRNVAEIRRNATPFNSEPLPEPDKYLFPESAWNMTGWANLNYGSKHY